jgi:hypothetical protein
MKKVFLITLLINIKLLCPGDQYCSECRVIDEKHTCLSCNYSAITSLNICKSVDKKIKKCIEYDQDNSLCKTCERNYGVAEKGKSCIKCDDKDCANCPNGNCLSCYKNVIPQDNSCQIEPSTSFCFDKNCEICNYTQECEKCVNHFALNETKRCVPSVEKCIEGDHEGCSKCEPGYYINEDMECHIFSEVIPHSSFQTFLIFIIICLFLGILGYFLSQKYKEKKKREADQRNIKENLLVEG